MKQLIALAAVLGLAVSSWGLTPQDAPNVTATPALGVEVAEAQVGSYYGPKIWRRMNVYGWVTDQSQFPHFQAMVEGAAAALGAFLGGSIGSTLGPAGTWAGGTLGAGFGAF